LAKANECNVTRRFVVWLPVVSALGARAPLRLAIHVLIIVLCFKFRGSHFGCTEAYTHLLLLEPRMRLYTRHVQHSTHTLKHKYLLFPVTLHAQDTSADAYTVLSQAPVFRVCALVAELRPPGTVHMRFGIQESCGTGGCQESCGTGGCLQGESGGELKTLRPSTRSPDWPRTHVGGW
jgi:hypothetical protein